MRTCNQTARNIKKMCPGYLWLGTGTDDMASITASDAGPYGVLVQAEHNVMFTKVSSVYPRKVSGILTNQGCMIFFLGVG